MTDELVEHVARAMHDAVTAPARAQSAHVVPFEELSSYFQRNFRTMAVAAVAAMSVGVPQHPGGGLDGHGGADADRGVALTKVDAEDSLALWDDRAFGVDATAPEHLPAVGHPDELLGRAPELIAHAGSVGEAGDLGAVA